MNKDKSIDIIVNEALIKFTAKDVIAIAALALTIVVVLFMGYKYSKNRYLKSRGNKNPTRDKESQDEIDDKEEPAESDKRIRMQTIG